MYSLGLGAWALVWLGHLALDVPICLTSTCTRVTLLRHACIAPRAHSCLLQPQLSCRLAFSSPRARRHFDAARFRAPCPHYATPWRNNAVYRLSRAKPASFATHLLTYRSHQSHCSCPTSRALRRMPVAGGLPAARRPLAGHGGGRAVLKRQQAEGQGSGGTLCAGV